MQTGMFSVLFFSFPESEQGLALQSPTQCSDADREPAHMEKLFRFKGDSVLMKDAVSS